MGQRSSQWSLFDAEYHFKHLGGENSFHWQLSQMRGELFWDEEFSELFCLNNGRPSVLPSLLATALLLRAHDEVSNAEAHRRARLDLGWKVALGVEADAKLFAQSMLQHFWAQLVLHDKLQAVFVRSLEWARHKELLQSKALRLILDTTPTTRGLWPWCPRVSTTRVAGCARPWPTQPTGTARPAGRSPRPTGP